MSCKKWLAYISAGLISIGGHIYPSITHAQANTAKQKFFDTVIEYAQKQGLDLNKLDSDKVEIKEEVIKDGEKVYGTFNRLTGKIEIQKLRLEDIATIGIHEGTHKKKYDPSNETELWFRKIDYMVGTIDEETVAMIVPKKSKLEKNLPQKVTLKQEGNKHLVYNENDEKIVEFQMLKIISNNEKTLRIMTADYPVGGVQGRFYYEKENKLLHYEPSEVIQFYNEIIARVYEQIFSGYYVGKNDTQKQADREITRLGKSLAYLTTQYILTPSQKKLSRDVEEACKKLNEDALVYIIENTLKIGGVEFKEMMQDLQDDEFAKSVSLASIIFPKEEFKALLETYDNKGKEEIKKMMMGHTNELQQTGRIGSLSEYEIMITHLKKFNLSEEEAKYIMHMTKTRDFKELFKSHEKIKHIENLKQMELERLLQPFKEKEAEITKAL
jgi:hypothetical protein